MSDWHEGIRKNHETLEFVGDINAITQRNRIIKQGDQASADRKQANRLKEQTLGALQEQNRIEKDRAKSEQARTEIERERLAAEKKEREDQRLQAEQVKQIRALMADTSVALERLKRLRPTP